jgi:hypothetical protein
MRAARIENFQRGNFMWGRKGKLPKSLAALTFAEDYGESNIFHNIIVFIS